MAEIIVTPEKLIVDAVWDRLETDEQFTDQVNPKNRIRFDQVEYFKPFKSKMDTADFPEVVLLMTQIPDSNLHIASNATEELMEFRFGIRAGCFQLDLKLSVIRHAIRRAIQDYKSYLFDLRYPIGATKAFVTKVDLGAYQLGDTIADQNAVVHGFQASYGFRVECIYDASLMRDIQE